MRATPSATYHDYFKLLPDDLNTNAPRTPGISELLSMKGNGSHHKYEKLSTEDSAV